MKIFFDCEFIEDGKTIDLISIGLVREDWETLYLENSECDLSRANPWVKKHVLPHLQGPRHTRDEIAKKIRQFVGGANPEFWAYYASYDWVTLCQLYGDMMSIPGDWPKFVKDLKQLQESVGNPHFPEPEKQHNALEDAMWNMRLFSHLVTHGARP